MAVRGVQREQMPLHGRGDDQARRRGVAGGRSRGLWPPGNRECYERSTGEQPGGKSLPGSHASSHYEVFPVFRAHQNPSMTQTCHSPQTRGGCHHPGATYPRQGSLAAEQAAARPQGALDRPHESRPRSTLPQCMQRSEWNSRPCAWPHRSPCTDTGTPRVPNRRSHAERSGSERVYPGLPSLLRVRRSSEGAWAEPGFGPARPVRWRSPPVVGRGTAGSRTRPDLARAVCGMSGPSQQTSPCPPLASRARERIASCPITTSTANLSWYGSR